MHTFLRILAITFLAAAILWGCTPLATALNPSRLSATNEVAQPLVVPTAVELTEISEYSPLLPKRSLPGTCLTHSVRVPRTNVWQCSVDDTVYDPCFTIGAEETIICAENLLDPASSFSVDLVAPLPISSLSATATSLDLKDLESLWYFGLDAVDGAVALHNGEYYAAANSNNPNATSIVVRLSELKTEGDLDMDGDLDAASVLIATFSDILSRYYLVAITNENGEAINSATVALGDGIRVDNLAIENGQLVVDMTTHGDQDPLCCPTFAETRFYGLSNNQLTVYTGAWQVELSSGTICSISTKMSDSNGFACSDGHMLLDSLQPGAVWTALRRSDESALPISTLDAETVSIRRLWQ